jgi:uncharacterized membrane protein YfcA
MDYDLTFFAVAIPAVLFAGISKGGFGSAAAFAASPLLALIIEPTQAVAVMLPLLIVMDFTAVRVYWRKWEPPTAKVLIIGGIPGAVLGAVLVTVANPDLFRFLIGLIAVAFVLWQLAKAWKWVPSPAKPFSDRAGYAFGVGAGFTSFIAHAGGPVTSVFMLTKGLTKTEFQATTVVVFWVSNLIKLVLYVGLGFLSWDTLRADLYLFPFAILGTYLGVWLNGIVPERIYFAFIYVCLIVAGTKLIFDALV